MKQSETVVVYIITELALGGAQKVCLSLFHKLKKKSISTALISSTEGGLADMVASSGSEVHLMPLLQRSIGIRMLFDELYTLCSMIRILRFYKKKYKNVIVHTHSTKAGLLGRWAAFFARVPLRMHTIHGYAFHQYQSWLVWLPIYLCEFITSFITTHFICVSSADVKTGVRLLPWFGSKHTIIRAAIDHEPFQRARESVRPFPKHKEPFIFGTVACFKPQKNLFDLLKAFKAVHMMFPHTRLEVVGDGVLRPAIEEWIMQELLGSVVILHGWQKMVAPIMQRWHVFALSSLWEGLPCSIVEAQSAHIPVISYQTGGVGDIIVDHNNGLLVPQKRVDLLTDAMIAVVADQQLYEKLQQNVPNLSEFYLDVMVDQHAACYHNFLKGRYNRPLFFYQDQ